MTKKEIMMMVKMIQGCSHKDKTWNPDLLSALVEAYIKIKKGE